MSYSQRPEEQPLSSVAESPGHDTALGWYLTTLEPTTINNNTNGCSYLKKCLDACLLASLTI